MSQFRCDIREHGKQCVLAKEHIGKVPCRFKPIEFAVCPSGAMQKPKAREAIVELARAAFTYAAIGARPLRDPVIEVKGCLKSAMLQFSIPLVPPSVNHYKKPIRGSRSFYVTPEAKAFFAAVGSLTKGSIRADLYEIWYTVFLGTNQRGDADNFGKVILDSLVRAAVITTDARVKHVHASVDRDRENPRTIITIQSWSEK